MFINAYLTTREVAKRLRVTVPTVQKFIRDGHLKAAKIGRTYLIDESDLRDFLLSRKT